MLLGKPKNRLGKPTKPSDPASGGPSTQSSGRAPVTSAVRDRTPNFPSILNQTSSSRPVEERQPEPAGGEQAPAGPQAVVEPGPVRPTTAPAGLRQPAVVPDVAPPIEQSPGVGRAGRDLPVAIAVGVGLAVAIVLSLVIYRPVFLLVVAAAVLISVWELTRALRTVRVRAPLTPLLLGSVAMIAVTWVSGPGGLAVTMLLTVLAVLVWRLSDGPVGYFRDSSTAVLVTVYIPLLACFAVLMLRPDDGVTRIVTFIVAVVCSDVGGYVAGVRFGKHPMAPTVSPKKSWEGLGGSVLACMIAGLLLVGLALGGAWWQGLLYGAAIAVTATLGDLGESIVKRDLGIKDMGTLLPGHGGLMDRMDSLLPSAAVAYLLLSLFIGTG